jgi:hypothetical protein
VKLATAQLSLAIGSTQFTTLLQLVFPGPVPTKMFDGVPVIIGGTVSLTVMVCTPTLATPHPSVTVYVR